MSVILYDNFCEFCTAWANFIRKDPEGISDWSDGNPGRRENSGV